MKLGLRFTSTFLSAFILLIAIINKAYAVCPLCTIVAVSGVGVSRYFGVDDTITGIWLGGLILSSGMWVNDILKKKKIKFPFRNFIIIISIYLITILPLYWMHIMGVANNKLWNIDKVLLGIIAGSLFFLVGVFINLILRTLNDCKVYFYFQKIVIPILLLLIANLIFYFITR
jgi:hypothetical protein